MTLTDRKSLASAFAIAILVIVGFASGASASKGNPQTARSETVSGSNGGLSLETQDAALATALLRVVTAPTSENLAAVADRYYHLGIRDKAMDYYTESLRRNATSVQALDGAARIWRDWGQMGRALGSAHRAKYFAPSSAAAWNTLGTILQALEQHAPAANAYRRAISLDAGAVYARNNLCYLSFIEGDAVRAIAECTAALGVDSHFTPALNNLALAYAATGDRRRSSHTFTAATGEAGGHYNTGIVLLARRDYAAAALAFEAAYRIEPSFDAAQARAREARRLARRMEATDVDR